MNPVESQEMIGSLAVDGLVHSDRVQPVTGGQVAVEKRKIAMTNKKTLDAQAVEMLHQAALKAGLNPYELPKLYPIYASW